MFTLFLVAGIAAAEPVSADCEARTQAFFDLARAPMVVSGSDDSSAVAKGLVAQTTRLADVLKAGGALLGGCGPQVDQQVAQELSRLMRGHSAALRLAPVPRGLDEEEQFLYEEVIEDRVEAMDGKAAFFELVAVSAASCSAGIGPCLPDYALLKDKVPPTPYCRKRR